MHGPPKEGTKENHRASWQLQGSNIDENRPAKDCKPEMIANEQQNYPKQFQRSPEHYSI